jgi:hypothetical protein
MPLKINKATNAKSVMIGSFFFCFLFAPVDRSTVLPADPPNPPYPPLYPHPRAPPHT